MVMYLMPSISTKVMNADHVPVGDLAREHQFALEAACDLADAVGSAAISGDHLTAPDTPSSASHRLIHGTHAANPKNFDDVVTGAEPCRSSRGHLL